MKNSFRIAAIAALFSFFLPFQTGYSQIESLKEKQSRLESEVETKTGDEKLSAYRDLLHMYFYVPDEIRAKHIEQMLSEYKPLNDSKGMGIALTALASLQTKQGKYKDAQQTCETATKYGLDCADSFPEIQFGLLCLQAKIANANGAPKESFRLARKAIAFGRPWGDELKLNYAYRSLLLSTRRLGAPYEDHPYFRKEYEYSQRAGDLHDQAAATLVMAYRFLRDNHLVKAGQWLSKTEEILSRINAPRLQLLARVRRIRLTHLRSPDLLQQLQSLNQLVATDLGPLTNSDKVMLWNEIVRVNCQLNQFDAAEKAVRKKLEFAKGSYINELSARLSAIECTILRSSFELEKKKDLLGSATQQLIEMEFATANIPRFDARRLRMLASAFEQNEQYLPALKAIRAENTVSRQVFKEDNLIQIGLIRESYNDRKRDLELGIAKQKQLAAEAELELQRSEKTATTRVRNLVGISTFVLAIGAVFGFWLHFSRLSRQQAHHAKQLSIELDQRTNELSLESEKRRTLAAENERKRRNETVGKIAGGIAHDFNNLLTVIIQSNEILGCNLGHEKAQDVLQRSNKAADTATDIVRQLMAYVSKTPLTNSLVDVDSWLEDVRGLFESAIPKPIDFKIKNSTKGLKVHSDSAQLTTAVINILTNAKDALHQRPEAKITLEIDLQKTADGPEQQKALSPKEDYIVIRVTDNGNGMTPAQLESACEPFVTSKNMGIGTGLGLSMVSGFARQSGGYLQIQSEKDFGTTVEIFSPAASPDPSHSNRSSISSSNCVLKSVLLVEDDKAVRDSISIILNRFGCRVQTASDGDEAILHLQTNPTPDLVLSDIQMPGSTNGIELRQWVIESELPAMVVLMSGFHQDKLDDNALVLPKPFRMSALENLIGTVQSRP